MSEYKNYFSKTVPLVNSVRVPASQLWIRRKITVLQESMSDLERLLRERQLKFSFVSIKDLIKWRCMPSMVLCCFGISEGEDMSRALHGVAVKAP